MLKNITELLNNNIPNKFYISGIYALNITNNDEDSFGDWHRNIWYNINEYPNSNITHFGDLGEFNTNDIWDSYGIYEGKGLLLKENNIITNYKNIYIANHRRAVLDLLYYYIKKYKVIWEVGEAAEEYILDNKKIIEMLDKSKYVVKYLNNDELFIYNKWYLKQEKYLMGE